MTQQLTAPANSVSDDIRKNPVAISAFDAWQSAAASWSNNGTHTPSRWAQSGIQELFTAVFQSVESHSHEVAAPTMCASSHHVVDSSPRLRTRGQAVRPFLPDKEFKGTMSPEGRRHIVGLAN